MKKTRPTIATFVSKKHDLFVAVHGKLSIDNDKATLDRLWNRFVAAWYEKGKDDPKLVLLRLDPKEDYKDNVVKVKLG